MRSETSALPFKTDVTLKPGDVVMATDDRGLVVYWNVEAERLFGVPRQRAVGRALTQVCRFDPVTPGPVLERVLAGRDFAAQVRCPGPDGAGLMLYIYATRGYAPDGKPVGVLLVARDVTDIWQVERVLRSSEDKYHILFDSSLDSVALADVDGRVLEANPTCLRLYGYTAEEVKEMNLVDVVAPEDQALAAQVMAELAQGRAATATLRMVRRDGGRLTVDVVASVITVGGDRRILSVTRDVSDRVKAEAALRESEERYHAIFESANDAVLVESVDGRILEVNGNACRLFGYTREELLELSVADLVPPEARVWLPRVADAILRDRAYRAEAVNVHKSGREIPVEVSASPVVVGDKTLVLAVVRDITQRKEAEAEIRRSEDRYRAIFETTGTATLITDERGCIVLANQQTYALFGAEPTQLIGRDWSALLVVEDRALADRPGPLELRVLDRQGKVRDCLVTRSSLPGGMVISLADLTERKRAESGLRQAEERYRNLFNHALIGIYRTTPDGRILLANPALLRMLEYDSLSDLQSRNLEADGYHSEYPRARFKERLEAEGSISALESVWHTRTGRMMFVRESAQVVRDASGQAVYYDGTVEDITVRKLAEQALRESEEQLRSLRDNAPIGLFRTTPAGELVSVNPAAVRMFGYESEDEMRGHKVIELYADPAERQKLLEQMVRDRRLTDTELKVRRRDGTEFTGLLNVYQVAGPDGKPQHFDGTIQDITERKRAEAAKHAAEARWRSLLESVRDGVYLLDRDGRFTYVNDVILKRSGRPRDWWLGRQELEVARPEDRDRLAQAFDAALRGEHVPPHVVAYTAATGALLYVELNSSPVYEAGRVVGVMGISRDVSERVRLERELRREKEQAQIYLNLAGVILVALDTSGRITLLNRRGCEVLKSAESAVLGRNWFDTFVPEGARVQVKEVFARLMAGEIEPVEYYENPVLTANGDERLIAWHNALLRDDAGRISGTLSSGEDVTDRTLAVKGMQESGEQYRRLVELSPDGIAVHQNGKVVLVNPAGARMLGYDSPTELVGKPVMEFVHPDDRALVLARIRRVVVEGRPGELVEERFCRKDGTYLPVEVINAPFFWLGQPAVQVVVRDISERKALSRAAEETVLQMQAILSHSPDGIAAESDGRIVYANWRFARIYGYDGPGQVANRPVTDFVSERDRARVAEYSLRRARGEPAPNHYTFQGRRRDGSSVEIEITVSAYSVRDKQFILGFLRPAAM